MGLVGCARGESVGAAADICALGVNSSFWPGSWELMAYLSM